MVLLWAWVFKYCSSSLKNTLCFEKRSKVTKKWSSQSFFQKFILNVKILRTDIFNYVILTVTQENSYCWGIRNFFMLKHFLHPLSNETKTWNEPGHLRRSSRSAFWAWQSITLTTVVVMLLPGVWGWLSIADETTSGSLDSIKNICRSMNSFKISRTLSS